MDGNGNTYLTGSFSGPADFDPGPGVVELSSLGENDVFVCKYDPDGALIWARSAEGGGLGEEIGRDIAVDGEGNVFVAGEFSDGAVDFDPGDGEYLLENQGESDAVGKH